MILRNFIWIIAGILILGGIALAEVYIDGSQITLTNANLTGDWIFAKVNYSNVQNAPSLFSGSWNDLADVPAGFADGTDDGAAGSSYNATYQATSDDVTANRTSFLSTYNSSYLTSYVDTNDSAYIAANVASWLSTYNASYAATSADVAANRSSWASTYNASYELTYNSTYAGWAYNMTTPAITAANAYTDSKVGSTTTNGTTTLKFSDSKLMIKVS